MKFVPVHELLAECVRQPWALGAYDTFNMEMTQGIVDAAVAERSPLILMMLPGFMPKADWPGVMATIAAAAERADVPVACQLDHCTTLEQVAWGIKLGASGVMLDASNLPFEENAALTRRAVEMCHAAGVSVEAELGHVGYSSEKISADDADARLTRVDEAVRFVAETQVDALAVAVGTIHGLYRGRPRIDFDRIRTLREALDIPLVLHGGSDTPDEAIQRAIVVGVDKINIWTDVRLAYLRAVNDTLAAAPLETCRFEKMMASARMSVCSATRQKMRGLRQRRQSDRFLSAGCCLELSLRAQRTPSNQEPLRQNPPSANLLWPVFANHLCGATGRGTSTGRKPFRLELRFFGSAGQARYIFPPQVHLWAGGGRWTRNALTFWRRSRSGTTKKASIRKRSPGASTNRGRWSRGCWIRRERPGWSR